MVSVVVNLNEELLDKLRARAEAAGKDVGTVAADLLAEVVDEDGGYVLSDEEEAALAEGDAAIDRGEYITLDEMRARLKAARNG